jgi:glycosyltransferase involved in cell wall biosynthesis
VFRIEQKGAPNRKTEGRLNLVYRMRILHVHSGNLYGGVETLLRTLAESRALCREMEPEFALCFDGRIASELRRAGTTVHMLGGVRARYPVQVIRARRRLMQILGARAFDAVICHMAWSLAIFGPPIRGLKLPLILWMHGDRDWFALWAALSRPDLVICNSRFTASTSTLKRFLNRVPFEILHCPVPHRTKKLDSAQREALRSSLDTKPEAIVVLQTSRMQALKGHRLLLDALALLAHMPQWVWWIAGGPQRPEEVEYATSLRAHAVNLSLDRRIRFLGERSDVAELVLAADIYCQPNFRPEAFGIAFIEAMHAGLPVVTTAAGGPLEILDESCGVLVRPEDVASLAAELEGLICSEGRRRQLAAAAVRRATELCDPATQLRLLHCMINGAIGRGAVH